MPRLLLPSTSWNYLRNQAKSRKQSRRKATEVMIDLVKTAQLSVCKKRRGRSKYLLSVDITVGDKAIPAKSLSYDALIESVMEYFHITEQQLTSSCCSKTAKVQAKSIGEWFHSCLITIL